MLLEENRHFSMTESESGRGSVVNTNLAAVGNSNSDVNYVNGLLVLVRGQ